MSDEETLKRKEGIKIMVKKALDLNWRSKLSTEQYTTVNRKVSRKLYDRVPDLRKLNTEETQRWEGIAGREVEKAVAQLGYGQSTNPSTGLGSASERSANAKENRKPETPREGVTA